MENQNSNACMERNNQVLLQEDLPSEYHELILVEMKAKRSISRKRDCERAKIQLLSELCISNDEAKDLALRIEEVNAKAMTYKLKLRSLIRASTNTSKDEQLVILPPKSRHQYTEALRELDDVKQQICSLQLDMASALEEKAKAEMEIQSSCADMRSYSKYIEELRRESEEASREQEFIDLARIEVEREFRNIEAQREAEAAHFADSMQKVTSRINNLHKEVSSAKPLQAKLVITASDVNVLQNEMQSIRAMDNCSHKAISVKGGSTDHNMQQEREISNSVLQSTKAELEAAKKQLSSVKEEGYNLMDGMDVIRQELIKIAAEKEQSSRTKKDYDSSLESLNTKLHKALSKMEIASVAKKRAEAIVSTLSAALPQLQSDVDAAKREMELIAEETKAVRTETEKTKSRAQLLKQRLHGAMKELKSVKASEANALDELKAITESLISERAISSLWSDTITLSKFEYYYLIKQAKAAQEVADKKVAAAEAWMKALEAENIERLRMKDEAAAGRREKVPIEGKGSTISKPKKALVFNKAIAKINELIKDHPEEEEEEEEEEEYYHTVQYCHDIKLAIAMPPRSITVPAGTTTSGRLNTATSSNNISLRQRRSFSPPRRSFSPPTSPSLANSKKKGKVIIMDKLAKLVRGRRYQKQIIISPAYNIDVNKSSDP